MYKVRGKRRRPCFTGYRARRRQASRRSRAGYDPTPEENLKNLQRAHDWCLDTGKGAKAAFNYWRYFGRSDVIDSSRLS